jgi:hypothetical protein
VKQVRIANQQAGGLFCFEWLTKAYKDKLGPDMRGYLGQLTFKLAIIHLTFAMIKISHVFFQLGLPSLPGKGLGVRNRFHNTLKRY